MSAQSDNHSALRYWPTRAGEYLAGSFRVCMTALAETTGRKTSLQLRGVRDYRFDTLFYESDHERSAQRIAVKRAHCPTGAHLSFHLGNQETQLVVLERPTIIELGHAFQIQIIGALFDQGRINGNNNPPRRSVEEQMVARTGSDKDQIPGSSYLATATSRGVPVHMDALIQLKMEHERRVFMFGYKDRAEIMFFEVDSSPRRLSAIPNRTARKKWNHTPFRENRYPFCL
jgi:hypothetical protein